MLTVLLLLTFLQTAHTFMPTSLHCRHHAPGMHHGRHVTAASCVADEPEVLEPDYRLSTVLAGAAGAVTLGTPFGLGVPLGLPLGALAAFLASRTKAVRFVFDCDSLEVTTDSGDGVRASGTNFATGTTNRWQYDLIDEWAMYPSVEAPVLVYFRETQTSTAGQGHLFPVLFEPQRLCALMDARVGADRRVTGPPRL